uniref:Cardiolipin synthase n=1 Tax=Moniliophthora roreri TaxID=221103 RepID=A0A0W0EW83_MONRR
MSSVLGTILDPAADKALMTTLTVTLTMKGMLPVPIAVLVLGRDVLLSLSALGLALINPQKTFSRYWDFSIPSAEVHPTGISKINTALQLLLMGTTTISPLLPFALDVPLQGLQYVVAVTTVWSGLSYIFSKDAVRVLSEHQK